MRNKKLLALALALVGHAALAGAYTVRAPLVAHLTGGDGSATSWFTETRVWNLGTAPAAVSVTDIIGCGDVHPISFTVPAGGIADLPYYFFGPDPADPTATADFMATVEFTSDQPITVDTSVNSYMVTPDQCPKPGASPDGPLTFPYFGGCVPIAGPLARGFDAYLLPGTRNGLSWLVVDWESFRSNLYLVNPSAAQLMVTATYHGVAADQSRTVSYSVAPHSLLILPEIFRNDVRLNTLGGSIERIGPYKALESAATAVFSAAGPFYVFAAVASNDYYGHPSVVNRFAIVQPVLLP